MGPRVLVVADVPGWAWDRKARAYHAHLHDRYAITVAYASQALPSYADYDVVHLFEVSQVHTLGAYPTRGQRGFKAVAGLTANVWRTWGAAQMQQWAQQVDALHGNSVLLADELKQFHPHVAYLPNGVDPEFFQRTRPHPPGLIAGHVGKPNPRKGGALIVEAARKAGVELRTVVRTSKLALPAAQMAAWYQDIHVMVTASNMDGTPNPMLEGAATQCALLSTPIGNMPEFIRNWHNGFLLKETLPYHGPTPAEGWPPYVLVADAWETDALRDALVDRLQWCAQHRDDVLAMGAAARRTVLEAWTWATQVQHVAALWDAVLAA